MNWLVLITGLAIGLGYLVRFMIGCCFGVWRIRQIHKQEIRQCLEAVEAAGLSHNVLMIAGGKP